MGCVMHLTHGLSIEGALMTALLEVENLRIGYQGRDVVKGISWSVGANERVAIVGESGSGKSQAVRAVADLLGAAARVHMDRLRFAGQDLLQAGPRGRASLRGKHIGMIMQDPGYSLNPGMRVGEQIAEMYRWHRREAPKAARQSAVDAMARLQIENPLSVYDKYSHELSGGMGQRVMIAMMLAAEPRLLIADEPTSALDRDNSRTVLELLDREVRARNMSLILISHDLDAVAAWCDRVIVMRQGEIIDSCVTPELGYERHPYTRALLTCVPRPGDHGSPLATLHDFDLSARP